MRKVQPEILTSSSVFINNFCVPLSKKKNHLFAVPTPVSQWYLKASCICRRRNELSERSGSDRSNKNHVKLLCRI